MRHLIFAGAVAALVGGCAVGQTINYHDAVLGLAASAPISLAIAVQDQRAEIARGDEPPTFVGWFRGGWGN
jgi:hypothetical protein